MELHVVYMNSSRNILTLSFPGELSVEAKMASSIFMYILQGAMLHLYHYF